MAAALGGRPKTPSWASPSYPELRIAADEPASLASAASGWLGGGRGRGDGSNPTDGNFVWGAQIGLFILFSESTRFAVLRAPERLTPVRRNTSRLRIALCAILFCLHLAAGLRYYQHLMQLPASAEAHYH